MIINIKLRTCCFTTGIQVLIYILLFCCTMLLPSLLFAQPMHLNVPFQSANSNVYDFPLTGGLNNPQFSEIDLNGDGIKDLVYFDRQGDVVVPFLNGGTSNTVDYSYAPEYAHRFPEVENWMLLRDYNCDFIEDLFAYRYDSNTGEAGITVYEATRDVQNNIVFTKVKNIIHYHLKQQTQLLNLFNSPMELPAIDDIDGDGDLDILNFSASGGYIEMYKNESQENGYGCDSLIYVFNDDCWGRIFESNAGSNYLNLSPDIDSCSHNQGWSPVKSSLHFGSTLLTLDMNNDGTKELIIGDLTYPNLSLLSNSGNPDTAYMTNVDYLFPQNSTAVNINAFPAAFYVDVNNDGAKDILAAPNTGSNSVDDENWYYSNTGTANFPVFTFQQKDFMVNEMIDLGTGSAPAFVDYNSDGLMDIVVGNDYSFINTSTEETYLVLYENTGTVNAPAYTLADTNFANIKQYNQRRLKPAFGDLDNDGDQDMILGTENGQLIYVANLGTAGTPSFPGISANYSSIDVGQNSTPQLIDVDRDGDLDLIIGELRGNINYYENTGTPAAAVFSNTATSETFGFIDAKLPGYLEGNSAPFLFDIAGEYHFFVGNEVGELWHYNNVDGNIMGAFTRVNSTLDSLDEGEESIVTIANINDDEALEILIGNKRGGLSLYSEFLLSGIHSLSSAKNSLSLFPNPGAAFINIVFEKAVNSEASIIISNLQGQIVKQKNSWIDQNTELDIFRLPPGIYILTVETAKGTFTKKMIKR